jgi:hypothetical protein
MLLKYKIKKEYEAENKIGIVIPGWGHVTLDGDNLTDEMAELSVKQGGPFFELAAEAKALTPAKAVQAIDSK